MEMMDCAPLGGVRVAPASDRKLVPRLRAATGEAHRRLELRLALIDPLAHEAHFVAVLKGFLGFHRAWERAVAKVGEVAPLHRGRGRIAHLEHDLAALGLDEQAIAAIPVCAAAVGLAANPARTLGSLYVMEGSTLGGQVIERALGDAAWAPAAGLSYFNPYGAATGTMWRTLREALEARSSDAAEPEIIQGALDTFALLAAWLPEGRAP